MYISPFVEQLVKGYDWICCRCCYSTANAKTLTTTAAVATSVAINTAIHISNAATTAINTIAAVSTTTFATCNINDNNSS